MNGFLQNKEEYLEDGVEFVNRERHIVSSYCNQKEYSFHHACYSSTSYSTSYSGVSGKGGGWNGGSCENDL